MPFPLMKLFTLGLKQASKYVATAAKQRAKTSERFKSIIVKSAQYYHSLQTKTRLDVLGMGKMKKKVQPLTEKQALDLGLDILGDAVIISCALGIYLLFESRPSGKGPDRGMEMRTEEIQNLKRTVADQELEMAHLSAQVRELERLIHSKTMYTDISEKVMQEYMKAEKNKKS